MTSLLQQFVTYGSAGLFIGGLTSYMFSANYQPEGTFFGSRWHAWVGHKFSSQQYTVRALVMPEREHVNCTGYVCKTCGFVAKEATHPNSDRYIPDIDFGPIPKWTTKNV